VKKDKDIIKEQVKKGGLPPLFPINQVGYERG